MVALIVGSIIYIVVFIVTSFFVNQRIQRGVTDPKVKAEYRK